VPDVNVVRENYRAVTPPLRDISSLGFNIWMECSHYNTYKLVREGEPVGELSSDLGFPRVLHRPEQPLK